MSGKASIARSKPDAQASDVGLYNCDFYSWTQTQAAVLRAGRLDEADLANIAEEIETLGRSEMATLRSAYRLILLRLLKMQFQPARASRSWGATVVGERGRAEPITANNLGLAPKRSELFVQAYAAARRKATAETGMDTKVFPVASPITLDEVEHQAFWPAA